jgi:hypothetical protein
VEVSVQIDYCEVVPHNARITVFRMRFSDNSDDEYDARDNDTGRFVSGYGSYKAAIAALGVA